MKSSNSSPLLFLCCLVVAQSGDTHPNPGPRAPRFPCGSCGKAVKQCHKAVLCDDCDKWYHKECIGLSSGLYKQFERLQNFTWICCTCGLPNFSSALFDLDISELSSHNVYSPLDTSFSSNPGLSIASSSPKPTSNKLKPNKHKKPLKSLVINCRSLRSNNKQIELQAILEETKPDIVFGTESWLDSNILTSEVFPNNFSVYRKDRADSPHGGVLNGP